MSQWLGTLVLTEDLGLIASQPPLVTPEGTRPAYDAQT